MDITKQYLEQQEAKRLPGRMSSFTSVFSNTTCFKALNERGKRRLRAGALLNSYTRPISAGLFV